MKTGTIWTIVISALLLGGGITFMVMYLKEKKKHEALTDAHKDLGIDVTPATTDTPAKLAVAPVMASVPTPVSNAVAVQTAVNTARTVSRFNA